MPVDGLQESGRIVIDPKILVGKPVVRGTRIPVEIVLEHLAYNNLDLNDLFAAFPRLTYDDVLACLAYAAQVLSEKGPFPAPTPLVDASSPPS